MGLKPPLNKSRTLNDDPIGYGSRGGGDVHLNCGERRKCGPAAVAPHAVQGGGDGRGKELWGRTSGRGREERCGFPALVATAQLRGSSQAGIRKALVFGRGGINVV